MRPGQKLIQGTLSLGIEGGVETAFIESLEPVFPFEMFAPGIEAAAQLPGAVDDPANSPVTAGNDRLQQAGLGVLPGDLQSPPG